MTVHLVPAFLHLVILWWSMPPPFTSSCPSQSTLIRSKKATLQHLFGWKMQSIHIYSVEKSNQVALILSKYGTQLSFSQKCFPVVPAIIFFADWPPGDLMTLTQTKSCREFLSRFSVFDANLPFSQAVTLSRPTTPHWKSFGRGSRRPEHNVTPSRIDPSAKKHNGTRPENWLFVKAT